MFLDEDVATQMGTIALVPQIVDAVRIPVIASGGIADARGIVAAFALGTWLVWWGASLQRSFTMEDIRSACLRVMPETAERCVDTVIIQRGGARR